MSRFEQVFALKFRGSIYMHIGKFVNCCHHSLCQHQRKLCVLTRGIRLCWIKAWRPWP